MLDGFRAAAARDPVLVVPTVDDVERFEEELTRDGDVVIGATVGTFDQLFALVARATDAPAGPALSRTQRLRLAREAASPGGAQDPRDLVAEARIPGGARGARLRAAGRAGRSARASRAGGGGGALRARDRLAVRVLPAGPRRPRPPRRPFPRRSGDHGVARASRRMGSATGLRLRLRRPDAGAAGAGQGALGEHGCDRRPAVGGPRVPHPRSRGPIRGAQGLRGGLDRAPGGRASVHAGARTLFEIERRFGEPDGRRADRERRRCRAAGVGGRAGGGGGRGRARWRGCSTTASARARSRSCSATRARPGRSTAGC